MKSRLMAGTFSILLVLLVMIGPVYLADSLEEIETSNPDIYTYEEIASSTIEQNIIPWWQYKNSTSVPEYDEVITTDSGTYFWASGWPSNQNPLSSSWDVTGYWDWFTAPTSTGGGVLFLKGGMSASAMVAGGMDNVSIGIDYPGNYQVIEISFGYGMDYFTSEASPVTIPSWSVSSGLNYFNCTLDNEELLFQSSYGGAYPMHTMFVLISFPDGWTSGDLIKTNWKICPDYLTVNSTVAGNTTYKPYVLVSSEYNLHRISMGVGGVLVIIAGLIASPLPIGEAFDSFLPINNHISSSTRKRTNRKKR